MAASGTFETISYVVSNIRCVLKNGRMIGHDADKFLPVKVLDVEFGKRDIGGIRPSIGGLRSRSLYFCQR